MTTGERAYDSLAARDDLLAGLIAQHPRPDPFSWGVLDDEVGGDPFAELVLHIVSQQLSTRAAFTIFGHLRAVMQGEVTPEASVAASFDALRAAGLSGAQARSIHDLGERVLDGRLSFDRLARSDDDTTLAELEAVRGIGPWSAQMFLPVGAHRIMAARARAQQTVEIPGASHAVAVSHPAETAQIVLEAASAGSPVTESV